MILHFFELSDAFDDFIVCFVLLKLAHASKAIYAGMSLVFEDVLLDLLYDRMLI